MKPEAIPLHHLKKHPVIQAIHQVSQRKQVPIYLVGGAVRDLLCQVPPEKDFDFVMERDLGEVTRLFARKISGSLFRLSADPPNYRVVCSCRSQRVEVDFSEFRGATLLEDLAHRDFTVNAIALGVDDLFRNDSPEFHDPLGGIEDLRAQVLRLASPHAFDQDPLRVLRAVRIAATRNLSLAPRTKDEIRRHCHRLTQVAVERIRSEFFKTMALSGAATQVRLLEEVGVLALLVPQTEALKARDTTEGAADRLVQALSWGEWCMEHVDELFPHFAEGLRSHLAEEIELDVARHSLLKTALLLLACQETCLPEEGVGSELGQRLRLGKRAARILKNLMESSGQVQRLMAMQERGPRICYRFFRDLGPEGLDALIVTWALVMASSPQKVGGEAETRLRNLMTSLIAYYFEDYVVRTPRPLLSGKDLMQRFGLRQGKTVGWLLAQLARAESEGRVSDRNDAFREAARLIAATPDHGLSALPKRETGKGTEPAQG